MENEVLWFRDIEKGVYPLLGEKSKMLSILYANGFNVPHGFIVPVEFYNKFLEKTKIKDNIKILMQNINPGDKEELQARANEIQRLIVTTEMPSDLKNMIIDAYKTLDIDEKKLQNIFDTKAKDILVAVRSDPLPGYNFDREAKDLHMFFLNIKGEKLLIRTVQACWASLYTAKAIEYRAGRNLSQIFCGMSVIVQRMIPARKSGYLYTTNPNNEYSSIVEAGLGMIKSPAGKTAPLSKYIVNTQIMDITNEDIKKQETRFIYDEDEGICSEEDITLLPVKKPLENSEAIELVKLGKQIETLFGVPQQVEWVYYNKFYIVDSKNLFAVEEKKAEEYINLGELQAQALRTEVEGKISEPLLGEIPKIAEEHEEVEVLYDEAKDKIIVEEKIEAGEEVKEKRFEVDPYKFLHETKKATVSTIPLIHDAIENAMRMKENDIDSSFDDLLAKQDYPYKHELELIKKLKDDFLAEKDVSLDDVKHALETAEDFIKYLKEHRWI